MRTDAPNPPSKLPTFGRPNFALSAAMVRSHTTCRTWPADGVSCHHRDDGFGAAPDLDVQIRDVKAPDGLFPEAPRRVRIFEVSASPRTFWSSARAEGVRSFPCQNNDPCLVASRASSRALCISTTVSGRKAFLTSGRFMVIFAILPPSRT